MSAKAGKARLYGDGGRMVKRARKGNAPAASSAVKAAVAAAVRRVGEKKGVDTVLTLSPILSTTNTNGSSFVLNLVQQGAGSWNRVGRKINLQSVRLRGTLTVTYTAVVATGQTFGNVVRMVLVWDKQPSGAAIPTFDTIFGKTDQTGAEATTFLDPVKYDNMDRFSVLRDCVYAASADQMLSAGTGPTAQSNLQFDEFVKLGNREVVFSGQSAPMTIADISTGALYVYFRVETNSATFTTVDVDAQSFARLRYVDV